MKKYVSLFLILALVFTSVQMTPVKAAAANVSGKISLIQEGAFVGTQWEDARETQRLWSAQAPATAKETIYQGLISMDETIDLSSYSMTFDELMSMIEELVNETPELFYLGSSVQAYEDDDGYITRYLPKYLYSANEVETMQDELDEAVAELMSGVGESWSDLEKALYVHDYLVSQFAYDTTFTKYNMYNLLVEGSAVCQGYTLAYIHIMNLLDIPCVAVPSDTMQHIWNQVQINGNWYHVDMTYDDPIPDIAGSVRHDNFLVSDTTISTRANCEHYDWVSDYICSDTTYDNYVWLKSHAPFVCGGSQWYYIDTATGTNAGIYQWDPETGTSQRVVDLSREKWYVDSDSYYTKLYAGLVYYDGNIYYNTANEICYFSVDNPEEICMVELPIGSENVWGIQLKDGKLTCSVGTNYNAITSNPTAIAFEEPEETLVPTATPTIVPTSVPITPTVSPVGTEVPVASSEPEVTEVPIVTPTSAPEASEAPVITPTSAPEVSEAPEATEVPVITPTFAPGVNEVPETSEAPVIIPTFAPILNVTPAPEVSMAPSITPTPTSGVQQETTVTQEDGTADNISADTKNTDAMKKLIRITAKKGKRKITVRVPKKLKTVIHINKKIIRNKKKIRKKYKLSAKKNKTGKIKIRLSKKLRKGMKIRVTIYTKQGKITVKKNVKGKK